MTNMRMAKLMNGVNCHAYRGFIVDNKVANTLLGISVNNDHW